MGLIDKPIESITEQDLLDLISNQVREGKGIEFKASLPGNADKDKKEFLADVSSFANASGGDLIFGIVAQKGVATQLIGLQLQSVDAEILRLDNVIRDGLDPRIPNVKLWPVSVTAGVALIIRVARSWNPPHRVKYGGTSRFYSRNSAGKYELEVSELRPLFALSASAIEHIRNFRIDRLSKIEAGEVSLPLKGEHRLVLHIVPFAAFDPLTRLDLAKLTLETDRLIPMNVYGEWNRPRHNFDGLLSFAQYEGSCYSYLQLFRNGSVEAVNTTLLKKAERENLPPERYIYDAYEDQVLETVKRIMSLQKELGVEPPIFVMLSFLSVRGYEMSFSGVSPLEEGHRIDRNDLILPEEVIESYDADLNSAMQRIYDIVWSAAGYSRPPERHGKR
jgi:hypothetical protein